MVADPDLLRSQPHAVLGAILLRDTALIMDQWSQRIRDEFPAARRLHEEALRDHLPQILHAIAEQLASTDADHVPHRAPARRHGETRWDDGWSISNVVHDYLLLRLVILDHLQQTLARPLQMIEIMAVGLVLDETISASIEAYEVGREQFVHGMEQQRTNELSERDRRKDEFLATLGHELRNPLAAIAGALEISRLATPAEPLFTEARDILDRQVQQLTRLVDDLLDISRITRGRLELRRARLEAGQLTTQVAQMLQPVFEMRRQSLRVEIADRLIWLDADPTRLQQILTNVLVNASKYTPPGGHIQLQTDCDEQAALFRVADDGRGIDADLLPRVFDLYTHGERPKHTPDLGLGIGLALVRQLVDLHGGSVMAESDGAGRGATFTIRIPLAQEAQVTPGQGTNGTAVESNGTSCRRVLVVEDHADLARMLSSLVVRCGPEVRVASDGPTALEAAREFQPDLVLLDIGLPGMSGYDVAAELRKLPGLQSAVLVALTGYGQEEDRQRTQTAGFSRHLVKPIAFDVLQQVLRTVCDQRS
ncbi:MAG: response regulator [Pirellulales bacterium]|nr:response regulator [Pirellulales bacterium]